MPRPATTTRRKERQISRANYILRCNRNIANTGNGNTNSANVNNEQTNNSIDYLKGTFKCALNVIPANFESYSCGLFNLECRYCRAKHLESEVTLRDRNSFTLCCHKGKVSASELQQNNFFNDLYNDLKSSNTVLKKRAKNYFENIRSYNSSFAMVSSEAKIADSLLGGVYHFKIHDVIYHRSGPLSVMYGRQPVYAQLYFYDVDTAVNYRMREQSNQSCESNLMHDISVQLQEVNPFVRSFLTMKDHCERTENINKEICMVIKVNRELDIRRYNDAIQTDVAVIFTTVDGEPPFERNMVAFSRTNGTVKNVSILDSSVDPLAYPLLFPNGDFGWHTNMFHNAAHTSRGQIRNKVTMLQYACFRLAIRDDFSLLHHSQKLFLQWIVDMYVRIESSRLHFIRQNQTNLRCEVYNHITDYLNSNSNIDVPLGRRVILPSSFTSSPRNMYQNYLDAMSIVQHFGKPSLFVTMTCNPNWPEIKNSIDSIESSNFRPEIVVRVFKSKLKELINCIVTEHVFGKVEAIIYTIEFQKRGLPHAHILITLCENDKIINTTDIDKVVCAEIPSIQTHPKLHEYVVKHMIHGPCGVLNKNSVCMRDDKCSKNYPKDFNQCTRESVNGYPLYRRRDNGMSVDIRGLSVDNRFVVPYNPYLLAKFNCHLNVEVCTTVKSVKYIYKYVYKGYDCATIQIGNINNNGESEPQIDEIKNYLNGRYVGSTEAAWRIFEFPMHFQSHTIIRLHIHLPNRQNIYFRPGQEQQAIDNIKPSKLIAFFTLNQFDSYAHQFKYTEIPLHYVWVESEKKWKKRLRGGNKVITRIYVVNPRDVELFHLRLLLLHVCGPKSFEDVKAYNGIIYNTFTEACHARGIASNDNEWRLCLDEAKQFNSPKQMRHLFAIICALNVPANALALWNQFKEHLSEDFLRTHCEEISFNRALIEIQEVLLSHNMSCLSIGLPAPTLREQISEIQQCNAIEEESLFNELYQRANSEQRQIIDRVIREVQCNDSESNVFCLTAHAGCGKTFTQTAIIHKLNALNLRCIATAFSGIASTLLLGGRTLHNVFKLPIKLLENTVPNIPPNSNDGQYINSSSLIIIDEISMCPLQALKAIDTLLKDLCTDQSKKRKLFGGKTVLLCGDFRQILPVVPHGSRATLIESCVTSWSEFHSFHHVTLSQNMRVLPNEVEFVEFLKKLGNGETTVFPQYGEDIIQISNQLLGNNNNIITEIFGNIAEDILSERVLKSVVLALKNEDCALVNNEILNLIPGDKKIYYSFDKVICDNESEVSNYPIEFLNTLTLSGLAPHKLELKINCIVLLIRNLNAKKGLVNGTRMRVKSLHNNTIDCEVLTGIAYGTRVLIPRINLTYSGINLPFNFQRTQFPIINAFAITINKSQGQTFEKVGILLKQPVFTHGQLYVAASRVKSFAGLRFYIMETNGQGNLANDERIFTKNIVFREVLNF